MRKVFVGAVALLLAGGIPAAAFAAGEAAHPPERAWSFEGPFGVYDRAELQRGYQVYREVCAACHSMHLVSFRNLQDVGFSEAAVKAIAAEYQITDGPDDTGEMFERPGLPSDKFKSPFPNEKAARAANGGAHPVDLSLVAKAREGGPDYIAALLAGYTEAPQGVEVGPGMSYNEYFPGHQIAMPPPLSEGQVTYEDGTESTVEQMAHDVSAFLMWAAEPKLEARHRLGFKVVIFLLVFTGILIVAKRKIWADVH